MFRNGIAARLVYGFGFHAAPNGRDDRRLDHRGINRLDRNLRADQRGQQPAPALRHQLPRQACTTGRSRSATSSSSRTPLARREAVALIGTLAAAYAENEARHADSRRRGRRQPRGAPHPRRHRGDPVRARIPSSSRSSRLQEADEIPRLRTPTIVLAEVSGAVSPTWLGAINEFNRLPGGRETSAIGADVGASAEGFQSARARHAPDRGRPPRSARRTPRRPLRDRARRPPLGRDAPPRRRRFGGSNRDSGPSRTRSATWPDTRRRVPLQGGRARAPRERDPVEREHPRERPPF